GHHLVALVPEIVGEAFQHLLFVFDDQHSTHECLPGPWPLIACGVSERRPSNVNPSGGRITCPAPAARAEPAALPQFPVPVLAAGSAGVSAASATGITRVKTLPSPGVLSTSTRPPW